MSKDYLIYLDVCCLNRPLDDLEQTRMRLEAEAITEIIQIGSLRDRLFWANDAQYKTVCQDNLTKFRCVYPGCNTPRKHII